jgi:hypothetical protein
MNSILEIILKAKDEMSAAVKGSTENVKKFDDAQEKAAKRTEKAGESFLKSQIALQALGKIYEMAKEGLDTLAKEGNTNAAGLLGSMEKLYDAGKRLFGAVLSQLGPILVPLIDGTIKLAEGVGQFIEKSNIGRQAVRFLIDGLALVLKAVDSGVIGWRMIGQVISFVFGQAVGAAEAGVAKIVRALATVVESAIGPAMLANRELGNQFAETFVKMNRSAAEWEKNSGKWKSANLIIDETPTIAGRAADSLLKYAEAGAQSAQALTESYAATYQAGQEAGEKTKDDTTKRQEDEQKALEEHTEKLGEIISKGLEDFYEKRTEDQEATRELYTEGMEAELQAWEEFAAGRKAITDTMLEDALFAIETEGLSEEEASLKRIALYQQVAESAAASADQRKNAEKAATQEIITLGNQLAEKWKTNVAKIQSVFTSMASVLLDSSKSTKEKLKEVFSQITDLVTASMQKQLDAAIETSAKSAAASAAGAAKEAGAASAGIVPKILSKAAELPFPANTIVAGLAIAAFNVLAKKIVSFFEDGGVVGGGGIVGGFGRRDSVINAVMPGEGVINRPATDAIGKSTVDYINQNKALPPGAGGGPTVVNLNMRLTADRGVILMPQQVALETAPFIIDLINTAVKDHGYHLYASDLLVSLPQPAGA